MSETPTQTQLDQTQLEPLEPQTQSQTTQSHNVMVFYDIHPDDLYTTHLRPLIIFYNNKVYNAFVKERIRPDMYYILGNRIYVKLWNDSRRNILVYISNMAQDNMFFVRDADIINVTENIIYEYDTRKLLCNGKNIILNGFDIIKAVDQLEQELTPALFALICYKLTRHF